MIHTEIYRPDPAKCCEACCFGTGEHAEWCKAREYVTDIEFAAPPIPEWVR